MIIHSATDLGLLIRDRRKQLGLDQRALAERVGVSRQWIGAVEGGKASAELGLVLKALRALDVEFSVAVREARVTRGRDRDAVDIDAIIDRAKGKRG
jgi:HTH-type transcriptional regulator / antitoxin HipB